MMYDIAIIGAGPNGLSLAKYAQESGLSCIVLEKESKICYNIKRLPNNFIFALSPVVDIKSFLGHASVSLKRFIKNSKGRSASSTLCSELK